MHNRQRLVNNGRLISRRGREGRNIFICHVTQTADNFPEGKPPLGK